MAKEKCIRCGWDWDGEPSKWRRGSPTPDCVCNTCWYSEITDLRSPRARGYAYQPETCPEHSFGSNDGQPVDDHCSRCGILWSERERAARAEKHCSVCNGPLPKFGYGRLGPPMCDACQRDTRARKREQRAANAASARRARVISGTGDSGERRELAALVRGLRGE